MRAKIEELEIIFANRSNFEMFTMEFGYIERKQIPDIDTLISDLNGGKIARNFEILINNAALSKRVTIIAKEIFDEIRDKIDAVMTPNAESFEFLKKKLLKIERIQRNAIEIFNSYDIHSFDSYGSFIRNILELYSKKIIPRMSDVRVKDDVLKNCHEILKTLTSGKSSYAVQIALQFGKVDEDGIFLDTIKSCVNEIAKLKFLIIEECIGDNEYEKYTVDEQIHGMIFRMLSFERDLRLDSGKLKMKQIALIYSYQKSQITRNNAIEIAKSFGYSSKNSGEALYQDYCYYCSRQNRIGNEDTGKKLKNKIELIESILSNLSGSAEIQAKDELEMLKSKYE